ncbi:MAG: type II toxin-antitoxin system HicA family toxin [Brevefilum sp.]|nr:type II toxin-antitoxin system HicA family toxin [Brevefilum sp.]
MSRKEKLLQRLLSRPKDLRFEELEKLILSFGYSLDRIRGSHAIYCKAGRSPLTIPVKTPVKSYLIKQVLAAIEDDLTDEE